MRHSKLAPRCCCASWPLVQRRNSLIDDTVQQTIPFPQETRCSVLITITTILIFLSTELQHPLHLCSALEYDVQRLSLRRPEDKILRNYFDINSDDPSLTDSSSASPNQLCLIIAWVSAAPGMGLVATQEITWS